MKNSKNIDRGTKSNKNDNSLSIDKFITDKSLITDNEYEVQAETPIINTTDNKKIKNKNITKEK